MTTQNSISVPSPNDHGKSKVMQDKDVYVIGETNEHMYTNIILIRAKSGFEPTVEW